jgi:putative membrane protein
MRKTLKPTAMFAAGSLLFVAPLAFAQERSGQNPTRQETHSSSQQETHSSAQQNRQSSAQQETQAETRQNTRGDETRTTATAGNKVSRAEKNFLTKAAQGGMAEVELGKLAQEKASSEDVKRIGETLVQDHTKANEEVQQIASNKGVNLPGETAGKHKSAVKRLSKLSGEEFDREFLRYQLKHHNEDIRQFEHTASRADTPEVKEFASNTLPVLKKHQEMVMQAARAAGIQVSSQGTADRMRQDQRQSYPRDDQPQRNIDPTQDPQQRQRDPVYDPQQRPRDPTYDPQRDRSPATTPPIVPR